MTHHLYATVPRLHPFVLSTNQKAARFSGVCVLVRLAIEVEPSIMYAVVDVGGVRLRLEWELVPAWISSRGA